MTSCHQHASLPTLPMTMTRGPDPQTSCAKGFSYGEAEGARTSSAQVDGWDVERADAGADGARASRPHTKLPMAKMYGQVTPLTTGNYISGRWHYIRATFTWDALPRMAQVVRDWKA